MRPFRLLFLALGLVVTSTGARAPDPVTVELIVSVSVGKSLITVGDVSLITGGDATARDRIARIDLTELKSRDASVVVGSRAVEYRLLLAGIEPAAVRVTGAERTTAVASRRPMTVEEVTAAARIELLRQVPVAADTVVIELAQPIVVKLPEVLADERPVIGAKPRGTPNATGRTQMDMTVSVGGEALLSFPVYLNARPVGPPVPGGPTRTGAQAAGAAPAAQVLIQPRTRVEIQANGPGLKATTVGEAQQSGKLGQTILVQNIDSKKIISARVTGPGTVEVDIGGVP